MRLEEYALWLQSVKSENCWIFKMHYSPGERTSASGRSSRKCDVSRQRFLDLRSPTVFWPIKGFMKGSTRCLFMQSKILVPRSA